MKRERAFYEQSVDVLDPALNGYGVIQVTNSLGLICRRDVMASANWGETF